MARLKLPMYEEILAMGKRELSKHLKRLRPVAMKRIKALMKADKLNYLKDIGKLNNFNNATEELTDLVAFLRKPFSQVKNINKFENKMYNTLQDHGYNINRKDIPEFNAFMAEVKAMHKGRRIPDSTRVAEAFIQAKRLKMSNKALMDNLKYWREHIEDLQKLKTSEALTNYSAKYIKNRIKSYKKREKAKNKK